MRKFVFGLHDRRVGKWGFVISMPRLWCLFCSNTTSLSIDRNVFSGRRLGGAVMPRTRDTLDSNNFLYFFPGTWYFEFRTSGLCCKHITFARDVALWKCLWGWTISVIIDDVNGILDATILTVDCYSSDSRSENAIPSLLLLDTWRQNE